MVFGGLEVSMARFAQNVLLVCALLVCAYAETENVVAIKGKYEFEDLIDNNEFVVVAFWSPMDSTSQVLAPEYEKAATQLKEEGIDVVLASVDGLADENEALIRIFEVNEFPTIKLYRDHELKGEDYKGEGDADGFAASMVDILKEKAGPASKPLISKEDVDARLEDLLRSPVVIGLFDAESGPEYEAFMIAAEALREFMAFSHTTDASILADQEMPSPAVVLFKSFDDHQVPYPGKWDEKELVKYLFMKSIPLVNELDFTPLSRGALKQLGESSLPRVLLAMDYSDEKTESLKEAFRAAAVENEYVIHFMQADEFTNKGIMKFFGMSEGMVPAIAIQDGDSGVTYLEEHIEPDAIAQWIEDFKAGKLEPITKSEPIPESNDDYAKVVVGKTFQDMVINSDKDVFIEFHAPWCGFCKEIAPIWEEVAEHFQKSENLLIAKMDATANDAVRKSKVFKVKGFPMMFFKKAGERESILYSGDRSLESFIEFVKEHTSFPLIEEPLKDKSSKDETLKDEPSREELLQEKLMKYMQGMEGSSSPSQDEPLKDEPSSEDLLQEKLMKYMKEHTNMPSEDELLEDESSKDEPLKDELLKDEPVKDEL